MASRKHLVPLVTALIVLVLSVWLSNSYLLNRLQDKDQPPPVLASRLADFQGKHPSAFVDHRQDFRSGSYEHHEICGGCYHAVANRDENIRCGFLIHQRMKEDSGLDLMTAAKAIATRSDSQKACARCHPDACSVQEKVYWRYDAQDRMPIIMDSTVPTLASIPTEHKIPARAVQNLTAFFSSPGNSVSTTRRYLFDYNPSIVILPPDMLEDLKKLVINSDNNNNNNNDDDDTPIYVASFRVSTQQSCFHPYETQAMYGGSWDNKPPVQDYLALALLRADLSILQDVVVDIKASGVFQSFAEDFRLFVLGGQLFVASYDLITPLRITTTTNTDIAQDGYTRLEPVYPGNTLAVAIRQFPSCPVCHNRPNKRCGKNLNYFSNTASTTTTNPVALVELWPTSPHVVQSVNLQQSCREARQQTSEEGTDLQTFSDAESSPHLPTTSWYTMEEIMFPHMEPSESILSRGRGGACCISIQHPQTGEELLVGVFHQKIPKFGKRAGKKLPLWRRTDGETTAIAPNQYLSRWYAFSRKPPFQIIAQSGLFCLGYPDALQQNTRPLVNTTLWKKLIFGGDGKVDTGTFSLLLNCPRIHFVSGISQKAGDPSKTLVAYGVNDCFSRLIEIETNSIARSLFLGLV